MAEAEAQNHKADDVLRNAMEAVDAANKHLNNAPVIDGIPQDAILARGLRSLDKQLHSLVAHLEDTDAEITRLTELRRQLKKLVSALDVARDDICEDAAVVQLGYDGNGFPSD